jgi:hypothetical protein
MSIDTSQLTGGQAVSKVLSISMVLAVSSLYSAIVLSQTPDVEECKRLKARIDQYTELRKTGGTAAEMEQWKRARAEYEEQFRSIGCHKLGTREMYDPN